MNIVVTGGMGFIGQEVVTKFADAGHPVTCVDFWDELVPVYEMQRWPIVEQVYRNLSRVNVWRPETLLEQLRGNFRPDVIVHAGAISDTENLGTDGTLFKQNVNYTSELLLTAKEARSDVVFISSAATYGTKGQPNNPYGLTKTMGERAVQAISGPIRTIVLRLFNVFGRNEHHKGRMASVPWKLSQAYARFERPSFKLHSPNASRDFVSVDTVASVIYAAARNLKETKGRAPYHQIFDVGTGNNTTFDDLDRLVMQATGNRQSCCEVVPTPTHLVGRYQGFTKAGISGVPVWNDGQSTADAIERYYGKQGS